MTTTIHKQRRPIDDPVAVPKPHPQYIPPPSTNLQNLNLPLHAIDANLERRIETAGKLVFHTVGDTGGIYGTEVQEAVAHAMETQFTGTSASPAADDPAFFYHLGDVIYFNGQSELYSSQFYEPYQYYPANIFAIPGNHDGDNKVQKGDAPDTESSLFGFVTNFCDSQRRYLSPYRPTMTQPYVYWTLETPLATIVGLYSNVDGLLDGRGTVEQQRWLENQLRIAPTDSCLILAVHHAPYSLDAVHGGYPDIGDAIDRASQAAGRYPDIVLSGHVHNYQRFTRSIGKRAIPYVVAGAGGYANTSSRMHKLQTKPDKTPLPTHSVTTHKDVTFEAFNQKDPGFLRITIDTRTLTCEYFIVPFNGTPVQIYDKFTLDWRKSAVTANSAMAAKPSVTSYKEDILPLFRLIDISHMKPLGVALDDYAYMSNSAGDGTFSDHANARQVYSRLTGDIEPRMPPGGPYWTDEQLSLFQQWMNQGFQP